MVVSGLAPGNGDILPGESAPVTSNLTCLNCSHEETGDVRLKDGRDTGCHVRAGSMPCPCCVCAVPLESILCLISYIQGPV